MVLVNGFLYLVLVNDFSKWFFREDRLCLAHERDCTTKEKKLCINSPLQEIKVMFFF